MKRTVPVLIALLLLSLSLPGLLVAQPPYAGGKREFRGVWIATVLNYDWPIARTHTPQQQRDSLVALLDMASGGNFNAVVFQVRPECDALYQSPYEPWSYWLTGTQGAAPSPIYDPLEFAVSETHKRGMELHAWLNPYRAYRETNTYARAASHVAETHPEWVLTCPDGYKFLNPGLQPVRDFFSTIVADVVRRYGVDGIHLDDYFYPYPEHLFTYEDTTTWRADPRGFPFDSLRSWRRDNVNLMIRQAYDSIQAIKPWVKFGVSPFGIWKPGVPAGTTGMDAYNIIACDATAWLKGSYVDYVVPQLYWTFGGGQDYGLLQSWWAGERNGRHMYTGNGTYRIAANGWPATEITGQIRLNQTNLLAQGSIQFRAQSLRHNDGGIMDRLLADVFRYPSLVPVMEWKETVPPNAPTGLQMVWNGLRGAYELTWQSPAAAADGDTACRYLVYRFRSSSAGPADAAVPRNLLGLTGSTAFVPPPRVDSTDVSYSFAVSALDKNNNESPVSAIVSPGAVLGPVQLASPQDGSATFGRTDAVRWFPLATALQYRVQVDTLGTFPEGGMILNALTSDTAAVPPGLIGGKVYYCRVAPGGQLAEGSWSEVRSFSPAWPLKPTLLTPVGITNVSRTPFFRWRGAGGTSFQVKVIDFSTLVTVVDTTLFDTLFTCTTILDPSRTHRWTVLAFNQYGAGEVSAEGSFRTGTQIVAVEEERAIPDQLTLGQNYPNPFNPSTRIRFGLPERTHVSLAVYDLLGRRVAVLHEGTLEAGWVEREFDGAGLASGVYLLRIQAGSDVRTRRMLLLK